MPSRDTNRNVSAPAGAGNVQQPNPLLDRVDSLALKGAAILGIALHNYFHLLVPVEHNEFDFDPQRVRAFMAAVQDPHQAIQALSSFLGHFGVQLFIFLSAYGLSLSHWDEPTSHRTFLWTRVKKLYPTFLLAILLWLVIGGLSQGALGPLKMLEANWARLLSTLFCISNFIPGHSLPPVGPWWFVPFIMQFYLIWPLVKRAAKRWGPYALALLALAGLGTLYTVNPFLVSRWSINLLFSPIGHMPELCLGIAVARYRFAPGLTWLACSSVVFVLSSMYNAWWPLSFISALLIMLWSYQHLHKLRQSGVLVYLGRRSLGIFLLNGFTRHPYLAAARYWNTWISGLILGLLSVVAAALCAELLARGEGRLRRMIERQPA